MHRLTFFSSLLVLVAACLGAAPHALASPGVGDAAPDFTLRTLDQKEVRLSAVAAEKPVLLVVLRGWPGYQCPICSKQVHDFVAHADEFRQRGVHVVMVYPGPADRLVAHAEEFLHDKEWPSDFTFVTDPDYVFTNAYALRWSAKKETAYPSTFVIGKDLKVAFSHVSHTHGDRISAQAALDATSAAK